MLYYLHQEVIGDQAERILDGADSRLVAFPALFSQRAEIHTRSLGPLFMRH